MAMIVFCEHCRREKGWRKPSIRVTRDPCDFCGGHDQVRKVQRNRLGQKVGEKLVNLPNFEHDERFLVGTRAETQLQEPLA